ncbi:class I SAM-dependent methyltransferase [Aliidiomarina indica]|uniref:class I SAM-dependent methyltransferase n=1 Tax=Aliidiomarina indica TaxID=2749147 RepID=UPI00188F897D|nr:class I SAM-dependent methyltransferase [Aliidiomarina indica]
MKHWSQYWKSSNALSSFAEGDAGRGYDGDVRTFWEFHLKDLDDNAVVVDVGTGNGALALLARQFAKQQKKDWTVHGVDAAAINPVEDVDGLPELKAMLSEIQFHGETDMSKLPFDDASVDCVVSQFAFEYADKKAAMKEILRVLKPGGKLVMLAHHHKSTIMQDSKTGVRVFDYTLNETPLFMQADLLLRIGLQYLKAGSVESWKTSQHGQATEKTTRWIMDMLRERFSSEAERVWVDDIIGRVARLIQVVDDADKAEQALRALGQEYNILLAHLMRVQDQVNASLTEADVKAMIKSAGKASKQNDYSDFVIGSEPFAWAIEIVKKAD